MAISKKLRQQVFDKYNGKCAYCGTELNKGWQVDHILPQYCGGGSHFENLNPCCIDCNSYKRYHDLEGYRRQLSKMLNKKPEYLFKSKTKMQVATKMGSIQHTKWNEVFYFETINN